eukprot:SAG31_NODE_46_length_30980_cov_226.095107_23_plen_171_part_00
MALPAVSICTLQSELLQTTVSICTLETVLIPCSYDSWYPTFCGLAGISARDDPPVPPLSVDLRDPHKDIYGEESFPQVDGVDLWPILTDPTIWSNYSAAHPDGLVLSKEVIVVGAHKLVVAQNFGWPPVNDWRLENGSWIYADNSTTPVCKFHTWLCCILISETVAMFHI